MSLQPKFQRFRLSSGEQGERALRAHEQSQQRWWKERRRRRRRLLHIQPPPRLRRGHDVGRRDRGRRQRRQEDEVFDERHRLSRQRRVLAGREGTTRSETGNSLSGQLIIFPSTSAF